MIISLRASPTMLLIISNISLLNFRYFQFQNPKSQVLQFAMIASRVLCLPCKFGTQGFAVSYVEDVPMFRRLPRSV